MSLMMDHINFLSDCLHCIHQTKLHICHYFRYTPRITPYTMKMHIIHKRFRQNNIAWVLPNIFFGRRPNASTRSTTDSCITFHNPTSKDQLTTPTKNWCAVTTKRRPINLGGPALRSTLYLVSRGGTRVTAILCRTNTLRFDAQRGLFFELRFGFEWNLACGPEMG